MKKRNLFVVFIGLLMVMCISSKVFADRRSYVWTYEYLTMPKGMAEFEYYLTVTVPDKNKSNINTWKHYLELEYGITGR
jgi:carbonic anhydrase